MNIKLKVFFAKLATCISVKFYYQLSYFHNRRKILNLKHPTNLSEYIISNIISGKINSYASYTDKYKVREYIEQKGLSRILPSLLGVWKYVEEIDYKLLPQKFALKLNFGCGFNVICFDKSSLNLNKTNDQLTLWLQQDVFWRAEPHYDLIERCIICEEFIEDNKGLFPIDYKFMCVNGIPDHILVVFDRDSDYKLVTYDLGWNKINLLTDDYFTEEDIPKPVNLNDMIEYATILSKDFDFVRVDLYDTGERVIFGELTFTPHGGLLRYYKMEALEKMAITLVNCESANANVVF